MLSAAEIIDVTRAMMWLTVVVSAPVLVVALVVGVAIGLFQALTSVQELTLTFVPKLAAIGLTFWISMNFMSNALVSFFQNELLPMIGGG
ncbi:MAG: flagellar biosynthetic protein FliQ [Pseudomonadota bacterium]